MWKIDNFLCAIMFLMGKRSKLDNNELATKGFVRSEFIKFEQKIDNRFADFEKKIEDKFELRFKQIEESFDRRTGVVLEEMNDIVRKIAEAYSIQIEGINTKINKNSEWLSNHEDRILRLESGN